MINNVYLNYHRPCGFSENYTDLRGKIKKKYNTYLTPYEKFKSLDNIERYLKDKIGFEKLDEIAYALSDNECADRMKKARELLFKSFKN